jgi:hypothetical protein
MLAVVCAAVAAVLALAAGGTYLLLRTHGSPQQTAARYLADWQRGRYAAMDAVSVGVPRGGLAGPLSQAAAQLGARHLRLRLGRVTPAGSSARKHSAWCV